MTEETVFHLDGEDSDTDAEQIDELNKGEEGEKKDDLNIEQETKKDTDPSLKEKPTKKDDKSKRENDPESTLTKEEYIEEIQAYNEHSVFQERLASLEIKYSKLIKMNLNQLIDLHNKIERLCSGGSNQNISTAIFFTATMLENMSRGSQNFNFEGITKEMKESSQIKDNTAKLDVKYGRGLKFSPVYQVPIDLIQLLVKTATANRSKYNAETKPNVVTTETKPQQNTVTPPIVNDSKTNVISSQNIVPDQQSPSKQLQVKGPDGKPLIVNF